MNKMRLKVSVGCIKNLIQPHIWDNSLYLEAASVPRLIFCSLTEMIWLVFTWLLPSFSHLLPCVCLQVPQNWAIKMNIFSWGNSQRNGVNTTDRKQQCLLTGNNSHIKSHMRQCCSEDNVFILKLCGCFIFVCFFCFLICWFVFCRWYSEVKP